MKKNFFVVLCILGLQCAAAQEMDRLDLSIFDAPSFSPVLGSYFTETVAKSLSARFDYMNMNLETHTIKAQYEGQSDMKEGQMNNAMVLNVRLTKSDALVRFAIPLYHGAVFTMGGPEADFDIKTSEYFLGSGLHIISDYVSLYGFVGYGAGSRLDSNRYNAAYRETLDAWEASGHSYEPVYPARKDYYEKSSGVLWSVMPEINMKKFPLLGSVLSLLKGYLAMDSSYGEFKPSYQTQLLSRNIPIGKSVISLAAITGSTWYNSEAKYTVYGGRFDTLIGSGPLYPLLVIEGGYRSFFDVIAANPSYYTDGPYGRLFLGVGVPVSSLRSYGSLCLTFESSPQNWPLPRFGVFIGYSGNIRANIYINYFDDDRAKGFQMAITIENGLYGIGLF